MNTVWAYIVIGHSSFSTGQIAIMQLPDRYEFLTTYERQAKIRACEALKIKESEAAVLDFKILGENVLFLKYLGGN